nr:exodeoxyribonuclease VII small subunit [Actinomyces sp. ZJ308]
MSSEMNPGPFSDQYPSDEYPDEYSAQNSPSSGASASSAPSGNRASGANEDVASLSYERAREELVAVVQRLEAGSVPLEDSLALWERGEALAQRCQTWLDDARARLAAVAQDDSED